jgi:hypothetical protein
MEKAEELKSLGKHKKQESNVLERTIIKRYIETILLLHNFKTSSI